jgi:hypothetical protein
MLHQRRTVFVPSYSPNVKFASILCDKYASGDLLLKKRVALTAISAGILSALKGKGLIQWSTQSFHVYDLNNQVGLHLLR